jgi:hypothetical protein
VSLSLGRETEVDPSLGLRLKAVKLSLGRNLKVSLSLGRETEVDPSLGLKLKVAKLSLGRKPRASQLGLGKRLLA